MQVRKVKPYSPGPQGELELLQDLGAVNDYLMEMAHELHGRTSTPLPYGRSLLTSQELEERLYSARLLTEALSVLPYYWEMTVLKSGLAQQLGSDWLQQSLEKRMSYEDHLEFIGEA